MKAVAITVPATAGGILIADGDRDHPQEVYVFVGAGQTVFIGDSTVTAAAGLPVAAGATSPPIHADSALYAIVAATTQAIVVLRQGG